MGETSSGERYPASAKGVVSRTMAVFRPQEAVILLIPRDGELRLEEAFSLLRPRLAELGLSRARCRWFLLSDRGGIYLHETVTAEAPWQNAGRGHRLCVINPENGTLCLSPGHLLNRPLTERLRDLLERFRITDRALWDRDAEKALAECLEHTRR